MLSLVLCNEEHVVEEVLVETRNQEVGCGPSRESVLVELILEVFQLMDSSV